MNKRFPVNTRKQFYLRLIKLVSVVINSVLLVLCWIMFYTDQMTAAYQQKGLFAIGFFYMLLTIALVHVYGGFDIGIMRISEIVYSQSLAILLTNMIAYILTIFLCEKLTNPLPLLGLQLAQMIVILITTLIASALSFRMTPKVRAAIIYKDDTDLETISIFPHFNRSYDVCRSIQNPGDYRSATNQLEGIDTVFVAGIDSTTRNGILKFCLENNIDIYMAPKIGDIIINGISPYHINGELFMKAQRAVLAPEYAAVKRGFDILASLLGIIITSPIMLIVALAIRLYDGGPALYKQVRLTKDHKEFKIFKFRSMRVDAERDGVARLASENDDRITPVGKIIRKLRIDELPQLFNILNGSMTIVGPRPERPEIAAQYEETFPAFSLRLQVKAGLTGYAQVYGRYNSEPYEKLQMDLMYINKMSILEDLKLMLATVKILFMAESTEGIAEGQVTALNEDMKDR